MDHATWERYYVQILDDFGFDREADEEAARILDALLDGERVGPGRLEGLLKGRTVIVAGNAPDLAEADLPTGDVLVAADEATSVLRDRGLRPDLIVTDLDGRVPDQVAANAEGAIAVVHAHGDNVAALRRWAPRFPGPVVASTQARPFGRVYNFGGFTDGDRGVFLADHFRAGRIRLVGFDFLHPSPKDPDPERKRRKLDWAYILIQSLGREDLPG